MLLPLQGLAAPANQLLKAADFQAVTRGDFLRAAVDAAGLDLPKTGSVPYSDVTGVLQGYVRAAQAQNALALFPAADGKFFPERSIRKGEALALVAALLNQTPGRGAKEASFTDLKTATEKSLAQLAIDKQWMKADADTVFGFQKTLRGKEAKLFLSRAFLTPNSSATGPRETQSAPVVKVRMQQTTSDIPFPAEQKVQEVWNILRQQYLYQDKINPDDAGDNAIQAVVNSLNDPYTTYMPKQKNADFQAQMKGEVEGIGATVEMTGGILTIVSPIRGSPAEKAGLKPKDQILSVDGVSLKNMTLDNAVSKVRGLKDTTAKLHIRRGSDEFDVDVVRAKITIPEVEITYDRNVAVVRIVQFWETTDTKFRDAMAQVNSQSPRAVILDLRNNPGGLLHAAEVVSSVFLPKDSPYVEIHERSAIRRETTEDDPVIKDGIPLIILMNKGSASASEIVAGALQDAGRAKIVGDVSYGKGTVQQVLQFSDGSSLKYTIAEWLTPKGRHINHAGIAPDVSISNSEGKDQQYDKAFEMLR